MFVFVFHGLKSEEEPKSNMKSVYKCIHEKTPDMNENVEKCLCVR